MKVSLFYQKKPNFNMSREDAARLTLADLERNYLLVTEDDFPETAIPDDVYLYYQDRPLHLPPSISHTSMSVGDIVVLGHQACICCTCGWYTVGSNPISEKISAS